MTVNVGGLSLFYSVIKDYLGSTCVCVEGGGHLCGKSPPICNLNSHELCDSCPCHHGDMARSFPFREGYKVLALMLWPRSFFLTIVGAPMNII